MINITIAEPKKLPGLQSCFISMNPFSSEVVNLLSNLPNRNYNPDTKIWEISIEKLNFLIDRLKSYPFNIYFNKLHQIKSEIPKNHIFKTKAFPYQLEGIEFSLQHKCCIIADEPGLGKSFQAIHTAICRKELNEVKQCLIICCVNSIKNNWKKEINLHSNESSFILGTRYRKNGNEYEGTVEDRISDLNNHQEFFLITNIETLRNDKFIIEVKKKKNINMIIVDEFHKGATNHTCAQGKGLQKLKDVSYKIALSGTPIINRPIDAYGVLKWLGVEKSTYGVFKGYYCEYGGIMNQDIIGYKNLGELRKSLTSCMIRRLKDSELKLPPKIEQIEYVNMTPSQTRIYNEVRDGLRKDIDLIIRSINPLSMLLRLRQAAIYTGILSSTVKESGKFDRLEQMIEELVESGRKCVVFSNWTSVTNPLYTRLARFNPLLITGEVPSQVRQQIVDNFQQNLNYKVLIGTVGALGTGLTLTAASTVFFTDLPWSDSEYQQNSDRVHRIGQSGTVNIIKLICSNTVDEKINSIIEKKSEYSSLIIDGKVSNKITKEMILNLIG